MKKFVVLLLMAAFCSCDKNDTSAPQPTANPYVITNEPVALNADEFDITGELHPEADMEVKEYGFVFDYAGSDTPKASLSYSYNKIIIGNAASAALLTNGKFSGKWNVSLPDARHAIRAYAILDNSIYYGKTFKYTAAPRGAWRRLQDFPGAPRSFATAFTLSGKGYVCLGWNDDTGSLKDMWEFDPATENWTRIGNFPGVPRSAAFGFVIGNKAYVGGGAELDHPARAAWALKDFYEFDGDTKQWKRLPHIPVELNGTGEGIYGTFCFAADGYGFVGGGKTGYMSSNYGVYRFNPDNNTWIAYGHAPSDYHNTWYKLNFAASFVLGDTAYIGTGETDDIRFEMTDKFFKYAYKTNTWEDGGFVPGGERTYCFGTSNSGYGYIGFGTRSVEVWQYKYSDTAGLWWKPASRVNTSPTVAYANEGGICFTINDKSYIGLGKPIDKVSKNTIFEFTHTR